MSTVRNTFSIEYTNISDQGREWTIDWHWWGEWGRSLRNPSGLTINRWEEVPELDDPAYEAILKKFGLEEWPEEFPREKIIRMSPAQLIAARREKEKNNPGLPRFEAGIAEKYAP